MNTNQQKTDGNFLELEVIIALYPGKCDLSKRVNMKPIHIKQLVVYLDPLNPDGLVTFKEGKSISSDGGKHDAPTTTVQVQVASLGFEVFGEIPNNRLSQSNQMKDFAISLLSDMMTRNISIGFRFFELIRDKMPDLSPTSLPNLKLELSKYTDREFLNAQAFNLDPNKNLLID